MKSPWNLSYSRSYLWTLSRSTELPPRYDRSIQICIEIVDLVLWYSWVPWNMVQLPLKLARGGTVHSIPKAWDADPPDWTCSSAATVVQHLRPRLWDALDMHVAFYSTSRQPWLAWLSNALRWSLSSADLFPWLHLRILFIHHTTINITRCARTSDAPTTNPYCPWVPCHSSFNHSSPSKPRMCCHRCAEIVWQTCMISCAFIF